MRGPSHVVQRPVLPRRGLLAGALLAGLAGCGFRPRGAPEFQFERLHLAGFAPDSPLRRELERHVAHLPLSLVAQRQQAQVVLEVVAERHDKTAVVTTTAAQVREWQLQLALDYRLITPQDELLLPVTQLRLSRDMTTTEAQALAKEREEADLRRALQSDAVTLLLRRLAAVRLK